MQSLFDHIGGDAVAGSVADELQTRVLADDLLAPHFAAIDTLRRRRAMESLVAVALGRPLDAWPPALELDGERLAAIVAHAVGVFRGRETDPDILDQIEMNLQSARERILRGRDA